MTRLFPALAIGLALTACSANNSHDGEQAAAAVPAVSTQPESNSAATVLTDTTKVKTWLTGVIEDYANNENPNVGFEHLSKAMTDDYHTYKQDAINLEYDSSDSAMTEEDFKKKWQGKYNTELVGNGGYLISAQDNGKVEVTKCNFIKHLDQEASL
ncbi:hypothetical protein EJV47_21240 [Hymenobacter gummosus]|uniref:Lipoprotein n=1 Tax=Hymenobacter gummosus TaxID=1776032 RepID=A0A3S0H226_9BACT|nr:hypothetical protein [Hymenobacter gummosus]RTQ46481.1 hypothetical protein EJV47_21240 [Hymenobacter gummosus]